MKKATVTAAQATEPKALGGAQANSQAVKPRRAARSTLENVVEEENEENEAPLEAVPRTSQAAGPTKRLTFPPSLNEEAEPKKKKRKILNGGAAKTLFDEDEAEVVRPGKASLGPSKTFPTWIKGGLSRPRSGVEAAGPAAFGAFSPLKKDRKVGFGV